MMLSKIKERIISFFNPRLSKDELNNLDKFEIIVDDDTGIFKVIKDNGTVVRLKLTTLLGAFKSKNVNYFIGEHCHYTALEAIYFFYRDKKYSSFMTLYYDYGLIKIDKKTLYFKKKNRKIPDKDAIDELKIVVKNLIKSIDDLIEEIKHEYEFRDY